MLTAAMTEEEKPCYVYCISAGRMVKVGLSSDPLKRMRTLQTAHTEQLHLVCCIRCTNRSCARSLEKKFHRDGVRWRINREWFKPGIEKLFWREAELFGREISSGKDFKKLMETSGFNRRNEMTDQELAEMIVELGVFLQVAPQINRKSFIIANSILLDADEFVRDWRVAGALMEKSHCTMLINRHHNEWSVGWDLDVEGNPEESLENESLPRAICEACVEALKVIE